MKTDEEFNLKAVTSIYEIKKVTHRCFVGKTDRSTDGAEKQIWNPDLTYDRWDTDA